MMNGKLNWLAVCVISLSLIGCGGGGGGGGASEVATPVAPVTPAVPLTATLTGTITDTTLAPVAGATVRINNTAAATTDAAGRYTITGLTENTSLLVAFAGPTAAFFPAAATVRLIGGKTTALDLFLTKATGQTVNAATGGTITSQTYLDPPGNAVYNLAANDLLSGAALYGGNATVYLAPVDVGKPGHGLAIFQASLGALVRVLAADTKILETYGSAGLNITDAAGTPLAIVAPPSSTLTIPIPATPAQLRTNAPASIDLWRLDTATGSWTHTPGETANKVGDTYTAAVSSPGLWRAAVERTQSAGELTAITGTLYFNNGTTASGATIYLNGTDHGFQSIGTTGANGTFSLPARTGRNFTLNFVVWANGAQWPYQQTITSLGAANAGLGNITLPYSPPVAGTTATATIKIDSMTTNTNPVQLGYLLAGGRQISGKEDTLAVEQISDVVFIANAAIPPFGAATLTPSRNGGGVQVVAGNTFEGLTTAPTVGYFTSADAPAQYTIANLETATLPVLVAVKTAQGHYAKISIDAVTAFGATGWQVTFRHAFSLTGTF